MQTALRLLNGEVDDKANHFSDDGHADMNEAGTHLKNEAFFTPEDEYEIIDEYNAELTDEMKAILDERLLEDEEDGISAEESINQLREKYGL